MRQTLGRKREHQKESDNGELGLPCKRVHANESSDDEKTDAEVVDYSMTLDVDTGHIDNLLDSLSINLIHMTEPSDGLDIIYSMYSNDIEYKTVDEQ